MCPLWGVGLVAPARKGGALRRSLLVEFCVALLYVDALSESIVIFTPLADALLALLDALLPLQIQNNDVNELFVNYAIKRKTILTKLDSILLK